MEDGSSIMCDERRATVLTFGKVGIVAGANLCRDRYLNSCSRKLFGDITFIRV